VASAFITSVKQSGATGNGVTDDSAAIQLAVNEALGRPVYFPPGTYLIGSQLSAGEAAVVIPDNTTLLLDKKTIIKFGSTQLASAGIRVQGSNFTMKGGEFQGTWDLAGQGTDSVSASDQTSLLNLKSSGVTLDGFHIEDVNFSKAAGRAIFAEDDFGNSTNYGRLVFRDLLLEQNFTAIQLNNNTLDVPVVGVVFENVVVRETGSPDPSNLSSLVGGNAIATVGTFSEMDFKSVQIYGCGRMSVELWLDESWMAAGHINQRISLENCFFDAARYRTLSILCRDLKIKDGTIKSGELTPNWLELAGENIKLSGNTIHGQGWTSTEVPNGANTKVGYTATDNVFFDVFNQGAGGFVNITHAKNVNVSRNSGSCSFAVKAGSPKREAFNVQYSTRVISEDNHVEFAAPCDRDAAYTWAALRDAKLHRNTVNFSGMSDGAIWAAFNVGMLQSCDVEGNKATTDTAFIVRGPSGLGSITAGSGFARYSGQASTEAHDGILNDPPQTPITSLPYVVGDTPTGAWVGHAREFATWDGGWTFEVIDAVYLTQTSAAWDLSHVPPAGVFLLSGTGWCDVEVIRNDFTAGENINAALGSGINFDTFGADTNLVYGGYFERNKDTVTFGDSMVLVDTNV